MAKQYRGKALKRLASRGRGTCPVCFSTRVKLLYQRKKENGEALTVCKRCVNTSVEKLSNIEPSNQPIAYRRKHRKTFYSRINPLIKKESS